MMATYHSDGHFATSSCWDQPRCLIESTKDGQLEVNEQTLSMLQQITDSVVVVAIVGLYRTGKSYLMNRLAGQPGFDLGSTVQSKTKGIWVWAVPHPTRRNCSLLLLDTEGLGDVEKGDANHDTWIFALAVLLSSTLVYNSMGTIDQNSLEKIHFVTEMSEHIKIKSNGSDEESAEFDKFFPSFIWAVRDFTLDLVIDGKTVTEDEYLEHALQMKSDAGRKVADYNLLRERIRIYFLRRRCFTFPRHVEEANSLKILESLKDSQLKLRLRFFSSSETVLGGLPICYVNAIRNGVVPCIESGVESTAKLENERAIKESVALYVKRFIETVKFPTETVLEVADCNLVRQCIRTYFPRRRCFTFPRPVEEANSLKILESLTDSQLKPKFLKETDKFLQHVFDSTQSKSANGRSINGRLLGGLPRCYVDAIRNGVVPCIESAVESTAKLENERAIKESVSLYEKRFRETVKSPTETVLEVSNCNHVCEKEAAEYFMKLAIFDAEKSYYQRMMEELAASYYRFVKENETSSQEACKMLLCSLHKLIEDDFETGKYACPGGYEVHRRNINSLIRKHREAPRKGIMSEEALCESMKQQEPTPAAVLKADEKLTEEAKKIEGPLYKKPRDYLVPCFVLVEEPHNAAVMVDSDTVDFNCKSHYGYRPTDQNPLKQDLFDGYSVWKEGESYICQEPGTNSESSADLNMKDYLVPCFVLMEEPLNAAVMVDSDTVDFNCKSDHGYRPTNQNPLKQDLFDGYSVWKEGEYYSCQEPCTNSESSADLNMKGCEAQCKTVTNKGHVIMTCLIEKTAVAAAALIAIIILSMGKKKGRRNEEAADVAPLKKKPTEGKLLETPRWRHFIVSTFLIFNILFLPIASCVLVEKPLNAAVMVGSDPVEFKCKSDQLVRLKWLIRQNQSTLILFNGYSISKEAESFCSVENKAPGEFCLKVTAIHEAAQTYICQEPDTIQESGADLIIIEREAQCKTDVNNSHVIMSCHVEFRGNWSPELEWRYNGKLITDGVNAAIVSNKTVSSTLTVPVSSNDRKYTCTTRFDIRGRPQWTTSDNIPDYVSYSVLIVKANQAITESATEIPPQLVYPGQEVNLRCPQAKPGDRVIWSAEDKSGRKFDIYDGYSLYPNLSGYSINNSSGVCSLAFVATKETAISYTCYIPGHPPVKERTIITLSDEDEEQFFPSGTPVGLVIGITVTALVTITVSISVIFYLRKRTNWRY